MQAKYVVVVSLRTRAKLRIDKQPVFADNLLRNQSERYKVCTLQSPSYKPT
jgi:hypothetical protein